MLFFSVVKNNTCFVGLMITVKRGSFFEYPVNSIEVGSLQMQPTDSSVKVGSLQMQPTDSSVKVGSLQMQPTDSDVKVGSLQLQPTDSRIKVGSLQLQPTDSSVKAGRSTKLCAPADITTCAEGSRGRIIFGETIIDVWKISGYTIPRWFTSDVM